MQLCCTRADTVLVGKSEEKSLLEDLGVNGRIRLKFVFKKWDRLIWLRTGADGGLL
jgi:hypothetical protein